MLPLPIALFTLTTVWLSVGAYLTMLHVDHIALTFDFIFGSDDELADLPEWAITALWRLTLIVSIVLWPVLMEDLKD